MNKLNFNHEPYEITSLKDGQTFQELVTDVDLATRAYNVVKKILPFVIARYPKHNPCDIESYLIREAMQIAAGFRRSPLKLNFEKNCEYFLKLRIKGFTRLNTTDRFTDYLGDISDSDGNTTDFLDTVVDPTTADKSFNDYMIAHKDFYNSLTERQRQVFSKMWDGATTTTELARELGCTRPTIYKELMAIRAAYEREGLSNFN